MLILMDMYDDYFILHERRDTNKSIISAATAKFESHFAGASLRKEMSVRC